MICQDTYTEHHPTAAGDTCRRCAAVLRPAPPTVIEYETLQDLCPTCQVSGMQPCVDPITGDDAPDHAGRPVDLATA